MQVDLIGVRPRRADGPVLLDVGEKPSGEGESEHDELLVGSRSRVERDSSRVRPSGMGSRRHNCQVCWADPSQRGVPEAALVTKR